MLDRTSRSTRAADRPAGKGTKQPDPGRAPGRKAAIRDEAPPPRPDEERYRRVLDTMREGFQIIGRDWRYVYLNDAAAAQGQRRREELVGRTMMECYPGIEKTEVFARLRHCMESGVPQSMDNEFVYPDGSRRCFALNIQPVPEGVSVLSLDLTERRNAEKSSRLLEAKLHGAFEHASTGMALVALDGRWLQVNPALCRLLGYDEKELLSRALPDLTHPDDREGDLAHVRQILAGEVPTATREKRYLHKSGQVVWVLSSVTLVREAAGLPSYFICHMQDLTGRKAAEERHARAEEQLLRSQKLEAIGRLAGGVAHDFNNLLAVITGYGELARREIPEGHRARPRLDSVLKAAQRAASLTRQLLAFSRRQVQQPCLLNLNVVASELDKMFERILGEDVECEILPAKDLGLIRADPSQIEQVLLNLVVNARDAMPRGGQLTIETANADFDEEYAAAHPPARPGPFVMLAISDTGTGMDAETQQHVFEPFFTTKPPGEGTGLGLATVYGIVKQSGGHIWLYSEPGRGTTFKVYLPRVDEGGTGAGAAETRAPGPAPRGSETVLLVEDSAALRSMIREVLAQQGYTVLEAPQGERALEVLAEHGGSVDLLLTDVVMPKIGGKMLADEVGERRPGIRVLYMSGYTDGAISRAGILREGVRLLDKPFTADRLARAVREALDGVQRR